MYIRGFLITVILSLFIFACSDFVFVYDTENNGRPNLLQNKTVAFISGSDANILRSLLNKRIKERISAKEKTKYLCF